MKCKICKDEILPDPDGWAGGHNAEPVVKGKCCGKCNNLIVIPSRFLEFNIRQRKK